jgi:hypothetical protein
MLSKRPRSRSLVDMWQASQPDKLASAFRHRLPGSGASTLHSVRMKLGSTPMQDSIDQARRALEDHRNAATARKLEREAAKPDPAGGIMDPDLCGKGSSVSEFDIGRPATGKTTGRWAGLTSSNVREPGGDIKRRDPTAFEKLHIIHVVKGKMSERELEDTKQLSVGNKRELERRFGFPCATLEGRFKLESIFVQFVAARRIGHGGLRPFGSNKPTSNGSQSRGARLRALHPKLSTKQQHLNPVLWALRVWFMTERAHNVEILSRHIIQRTIFQ